jgi:predicted DCC family thiol-disulfide oxidoreductase YuxK
MLATQSSESEIASSVSPAGRSVLLYDGECGLCQYTVRWMLRHDPHGRMLFAAQQQPIAAEVLARHGLDKQQLNTAILVTHFATPDERLFLRSDAILGCLKALGGVWRLLAFVGGAVPLPLRNAVYGWVARNRLRFFGTGDSCTLPTPAERARFLAG